MGRNFQGFRRQISRKNRTCDVCNGPINPGDEYERIVTYWGDEEDVMSWDYVFCCGLCFQRRDEEEELRWAKVGAYGC